MIQAHDKKNPPKNLKEFWNIFCDFTEKIQKLDKENKGLKYWLPIIVSAGVAIALVGITYGIGVGWFHPPPEYVKEVNVITFSNVYRDRDVESYLITIHNFGDKPANDLRIRIEFPSNMTITKIIYEGGILVTNKTQWNNLSFCEPRYAGIAVNETIQINILLNNTDGDFILSYDEAWGIPPDKKQVWADGDEVPFSESYSWKLFE